MRRGRVIIKYSQERGFPFAQLVQLQFGAPANLHLGHGWMPRALSLLKPGKESRGLLGRFFNWFNSGFGKVMHVYLVGSDALLHKVAFSILLLIAVALSAGFFGSRLPTGFLPEEDQGYIYMNAQLPTAASLERTDDVAKKIEAILKDTPGVQTYNTIVGLSLLSLANTSYNALYFVTLKPWDERGSGLTAAAIIQKLNQRLAGLSDAQAFAFSPRLKRLADKKLLFLAGWLRPAGVSRLGRY